VPGVSRAIARNQRGIWLVEIDVGRVFRFALEAVTVVNIAGESLRYFGGLSDFALGTSIGAEASVAVTIDSSDGVQSSALSWAKLVAEGVDLEERPATLRRWFPGQVLEEGRVWLRGTTHSAEYGGPDDPPGRLTISIERRPTRGRTIPGPQERVDSTTWPVSAGATIDDAVLGATYPVPFGAPGHNPSAAFPDPAIPALLVEYQSVGTDDRLVFARGRVQAIAVELYDETNVPPLREKRTVKTMLDALGQRVSYVDFIGSALIATEGSKYYVGMLADGGTNYGGGTIDTRTGKLVRSAVEVIEWALRMNGTTVDYASMAQLRSRLGSYYFDGVINSPVVPFDWLRQEILPLMSLVEREGEFGIYYALERWDSDEVDAGVRFDVDAGAIRQTAPLVLREEGEIYNQFSIEYAPHLITGKMLRRRILTGDAGFIGDTGDPAITADTRVLGDLRCALSQRLYRSGDNRTGVRPAPPIRSMSVRDDATAVSLLRDQAAKSALPKRATQLTGGTDWEWLEEGAVGVFVNSAVGCPGNICRVDNVTVGGSGDVVVDITLLDDPIQTSRLV